MMKEADIIAKYGQPGDPDNITKITLPYPMRIAWDIKTSVSKIACHKLISLNLIATFQDLLAQYGIGEIQRLGIDLFGGCLNVRPMRGTENRAHPVWSRHAWGIAIDLSPEKNGLKTKWKDAQFSKPEYANMVSIFYKHGFFNLGRERNYDAMHFEIAS